MASREKGCGKVLDDLSALRVRAKQQQGLEEDLGLERPEDESPLWKAVDRAGIDDTEPDPFQHERADGTRIGRFDQDAWLGTCFLECLSQASAGPVFWRERDEGLTVEIGGSDRLSTLQGMTGWQRAQGADALKGPMLDTGYVDLVGCEPDIELPARD